MESYFFELVHLVLRYFHVVAGIAWIGASFYFAWLDSNLEEPPQWKKDKGIRGDLWAVHGGGFYEIAKYQHGPEKMPINLHWFKWEAYTSWLTGFLLFTLLYYVSADIYLLDNSKMLLDKVTAIATSLGFIALGYVVYRVLSNSRLVEKGLVFAAVSVAFLALWTWGLDQIFSDRAVYIHVGALIGTCMAGNVYHVIMPSQRYMVKEVEEGRIPDSAPGLKAKLCSIHNNYATLPIIFIMLSNHFPYTYSHQYGWLILIALFVIGMWIRHFFNLKNQGSYQPKVLISGIAAFFALMIAIAPWHTMKSQPSVSQSQPLVEGHIIDDTIDDTKALAIINARCTECHSKTPTSSMFKTAPAGFVLDSLLDAKTFSQSIYNRAIITKDMPLANLTKMTVQEREQLATWLLAQDKD